jgi:hypothetical protein
MTQSLFVVQAANGDPYKIRTTRSGFQAGTREKQRYMTQVSHEPKAETIIQDFAGQIFPSAAPFKVDTG